MASINHKSRGRIFVGGLLFCYPLAGVTWQHLHYLLGLRRLGWDVTYIESGEWYPYSPVVNDLTPDVSPNVAWVARILECFGLTDRWHYHTVWDDRSYGLERATTLRRLREADAFINLCAAQLLTEDHLACPRRLLLETDPVAVQVKLAQNDADSFAFLQAHTTLFSFGENLGTEVCPLATGGFTWHPTRQVVLPDLWECAPPPPSAPYTTIGNWEAAGKDVILDGRVYHWQKGLEFVKVRELPGQVDVPFLLAMNFDHPADRAMMECHGWRTQPALEISMDLDTYRAFIQRSRGEFTVAKEQNIVFRTGWFSDRAATYLASGRPVVNQDTGFDRNLPIGEGLFSFQTLEDCVAALQAIEADYPRHSRAAREITHAYFSADVVLPKLLQAAGLEG